jgi:glycosyltransferase involved in cell wall biosynthesis
MKKYRVLIAAGMIDRKLNSKIQPILSQSQVECVYLVRNKPFEAEKLICYFPKGLFAKFKILSEIYRLHIIFWLLITGRVDLLIGIGHIPHGLFICSMGRLFRKKIILLLMGKNDLYLTYPNDKIRQKIALKIAKWSTLIGTRGSSSANWLEKQGIPRNKIFIPPNVFDFNDFFPVNVEKKYDLVYVGLINYYKRVDLIIDVVEKLVKDFNKKSLKVAIIGEGKLKKEIIDLAMEKKLENVIDFLPAGGKEYLNEKLNQSKIFVMTSQGEGLPMVIVEALSCGLPIVIFDDADISDVAIHNYNSLLCNLWDTTSFAKNINFLLNDSNLYERLSKNALNIRKEFEFKYSLENLQIIWKNVIGNLD